MALGLDRNDEIIKRRLAQKMDFLAADVAAMQEPSNAELREWFSTNSGRFALPPHASFRHLYFSPTNAKLRAERCHGRTWRHCRQTCRLPEVAAVADQFMLRNYYGNSTPDQMVKEFGPAFSAELFALKPGAWQGPVQSGYGWHLGWIDAMEHSRVPAFEEVETDVKSAWIDARYQEINVLPLMRCARATR